jgi:hypothetical protein
MGSWLMILKKRKRRKERQLLISGAKWLILQLLEEEKIY